jgi:putative Mn2+ efflux pump MntP
MGVFAQALIIATAISIDAFAASFAYGGKRIKIPILSVLIINAVCSLMLGISLFAGAVARNYIPEMATTLICFSILFILGILKFFDNGETKNHDADNSKIISAGEAVALAVALSLDGLAAGFGVALGFANAWAVILCTFVVGTGAVAFGSYFGRKIAGKMKISWISGVLLIGLAVFRLL